MRGSYLACFFLSPTLKGGKKPGYDSDSVLCVVDLKTEELFSSLVLVWRGELQRGCDNEEKE
ncbi:MAG: hypothetical protein C0512_13015 [Flavobacterium sp.]|nr:hypothetical protein [Flavobacterium sp.]